MLCHVPPVLVAKKIPYRFVCWLIQQKCSHVPLCGRGKLTSGWLIVCRSKIKDYGLGMFLTSTTLESQGSRSLRRIILHNSISWAHRRARSVALTSVACSLLSPAGNLVGKRTKSLLAFFAGAVKGGNVWMSSSVRLVVMAVRFLQTVFSQLSVLHDRYFF